MATIKLGTHGRICTCTRDVLDVVPLLLGYVGKKVVLPARVALALGGF